MRLHVIGTLRGFIDGVEVAPPQNALALAYHLAVRGAPVPRSELAGLLWSNHSEDRARGNLRVLLTRSKSTLGDQLVADRRSVRLVGPVALDIDGIETMDAKALAAVGAHELLAGWPDSDTLFDDWLAGQRASVRQQIVARLAVVSAEAERAGQWAEMEEAARVLLQLDPWSEPAAVQLVAAVRHLRGTPFALQAYQAFVDRLNTDLGVAPSRQTRDAVAELTGDGPASAVSSADQRAAVPADPTSEGRHLVANGHFDDAVELLSAATEPGGDDAAIGLLAIALASIGRRGPARKVISDHTAALAVGGRDPSRMLENIEWHILSGSPNLTDLVSVVSERRRRTRVVPAMPRTLGVPDVALDRVTTCDGRPVVVRELGREGACVLVPGESGSGKTTLLAQSASALHSDGCWVLHGSCTRGGQALEPFTQVVGELAARLPSRLLRDHVTELGGALERLTPTIAARVDTSATAAPQHADERTVFFDAMVDLFNRAGQLVDLVIVIDDAHWAGPASLDLLSYLQHRLDRGMLLVGYRHTRPDLQPEARHVFASMTRAGATLLDPVAPFSDDEVSELVAQHASSLDRPLDDEPSLVASVIADSAGHPLFVSELVTHHLAPGQVPTSAGGGSPVPSTLKELVWQRADALGTGAVDMLEMAAVLRPRVGISALVELLDSSEHTSAQLIDDAIASGLLVASERDDELQFRHDIVASAVYDDIGPARRRALHARAGDADAKRHLALGDHADASGVVEAAARHYRSAGLPDQAWVWEARAGHLADAVFDFHGAADWFALALDSAQQAGVGGQPLLELELDHGSSLHRAGSPQARAALLAVGRRAMDAGTDEVLVRAATMNTRGFQLSWDPERVAQLEAALAAERNADQRAIIQSLLAMELHSGPRAGEVDALVDAAWRHAAAAEDRAVTAQVGSNLTNALWRPDGLLRRRQIAAESLDHLESLGDAAAQFRLAWAAHSAAVEAGDGGAARSLLATMRALAEQSTSRQTDWPMGLVDTFWETMRGNLDRAEELVDATFGTSVELGESDGFQMYAAQLMVIRSYRGDIDDLFGVVEGAANEEGASVAVEAAFGIMCARAGRPEEARQILHRAVDAGFPGVAADFMFVSSMMAYSIMTNELRDKAVAELLVDQLAPSAETVAFSGMTSQGSVGLQLGMLSILLGRHDAAEHYLAHSLDVHEDLGWPIYTASSRVALARNRMAQHGSGDTIAGQLLDEALSTCIGHGFGPLEAVVRRIADEP